ncbi:MAG: DMT family transporter [Candidatus Korobacteraceae bacterium]
MLVFITFVWGSTFVLVKNALLDAAPLTFNAVRFGASAVILVVIFRRHLANISRQTVLAGIGVGLCLCSGYQFQNLGLRLTTPSKSAFLTGIAVVLVPVFLAVFWRRRVNGWTLAGVAAAFFGLYLLAVPGDVGLGGINLGDLLTLGCAVSFAFQIIVLGRATQKHEFGQIVVVEIATCAVVMAVSAPLLEPVRIVWSPTVLWALGITSLISTCTGFVVQGWAQQFTPPTHTALIFSLEPVFAWVTSYLLLGERLGLRAAAGAGLILAGVLISELLGQVRQPEVELAKEVR